MFDDIGNKIKLLAKCTFICEAIASIIAAIIMLSGTEEELGLVLLICGPLIAWSSSWVLYGFGQLVENSDIIAAEFSRKNAKHQKDCVKEERRKQDQMRKAAKSSIESSSVDEGTYIDIICPNCQAELSYPKGQLKESNSVVCPMCDASITI